MPPPNEQIFYLTLPSTLECAHFWLARNHQLYLPVADDVEVVDLPVFVVGFVDDVAAYSDCSLIAAAENIHNEFKQ